MFIYKITHKESGRFYIGKTIQRLRSRLKQHQLNSSNKILNNLFNKYELTDFEYLVLERRDYKDEKELTELEQYYLDKHFDETLCLNRDKCSRGISSERATAIGKERDLKWVNQIKAGAKTWRENNPDKSLEVCRANLKKGREALDKWHAENYEQNKQQIISEGSKYHKNKTKEQEQSRRDKVKASHEARLIPILMFDLNNNFIGEYKSMRHIIREHPSLHRRGVQKMLKGEYSQHKGYTFIYKQSGPKSSNTL